VSFLRKLIRRSRPIDTPASTSAGNEEPQDDLERMVVEARAGRVPIRDLVERLFASELCVLLDREVPGVMASGTSPLVVKKSDGTELVAVFSTLARATPVARRVETHKFCLLVSARWLLGSMDRRFGLVLNPGDSITFEMTASGLESGRREFAG
jgi:hypothetical protein